MTETVTIPKAEYQRLSAVEEDHADIRAVLAVQARVDAGTEELVPAAMVSRLIDGESPLRVWREYRGLSQAALARTADTSRVQIVDIEAGRRTGSVRTLRRLADALGVGLDDVVPG
ncbi:MAG: helix-turn-helix transcriptional regulator [Holophagales bacterium]|nr:helix-turn-helix transcriptional regulator [Holophagales bacterium]MYF94716.1 helix-turn-helix transcriptional regulator [Holophagales bacterium]